MKVPDKILCVLNSGNLAGARRSAMSTVGAGMTKLSIKNTPIMPIKTTHASISLRESFLFSIALYLPTVLKLAEVALPPVLICGFVFVPFAVRI